MSDYSPYKKLINELTRAQHTGDSTRNAVQEFTYFLNSVGYTTTAVQLQSVVWEIKCVKEAELRNHQMTVRCVFQTVPVGVGLAKDFHISLEARHMSGFIVCESGFTSDAVMYASKYDNLFLVGFAAFIGMLNPIEYIRRLVYDFEHYDEVANSRRDHLLSVMERDDIYRFYVSPPVRDEHHRLVESVDVYFDNWLNDPLSNQLILLGDFGVGKTTACLYFLYRLAVDYLDNSASSRVPIWVDLADYRGRISIDDILLSKLSSFGIHCNAEILWELLRAGSFLIVLDGFDEMDTGSDHQVNHHNFGEFVKLSIPQNKVILTCRQHYFKQDEAVDDLISGRDLDLLMSVRQRQDIIVAHIDGFTDENVSSYISKSAPDTKDQVMRVIRHIYDLADLAHRPILLRMIVRTALNLVNTQKTNVCSIYEAYTSYWLKYQDWRSTMTPDEKEFFTEELALRMFTTDRNTIKYTEIPQSILDHFPGVRFSRQELNELDRDIRTSSFLTRDEVGNYRFTHRSFYEFFTARKMARALRNGKSFRSIFIDIEGHFDKFFPKINTKVMLDFLRCMLELGKDTGVLEQLLESENTLDRFLAVYLLVRITADDLHKPFRRLLDREQDSYVRREIIFSLARNGYTDYFREYIQLLHGNPDIQRESVQKGFIDFHGSVERSIQICEERLANRVDTNVRLIYINTLGEIGDKDSLAILSLYEGDLDAMVGQEVAIAKQKILSRESSQCGI